MYAELCIVRYMKICSKCRKEKENSEFKKDKRVKSGLQASCKKCTYGLRAKNYSAYRKTERAREMKKYGITSEKYDEMLLVQNNNCAICKRDKSHSLHGRLCVDHNHITGKVRQLLCTGCNTLIGSAKENEQTLQEAVEYLIKHRS